MNQWVFLGFVLSFIAGFKYCKEELRNPLLITFAIFICYFIYTKYKKNGKEGFTSSEDDSRLVRYGDIITLWSPNVNKYIQADSTFGNEMNKKSLGKVKLSNSLLGPEDLPSTMMGIQFMIVDANDPGDLGNTSTVKYGSPIFLRSIYYDASGVLPAYIAPDKDNNIYMSTQRYDGDSEKAQQKIIFESAKGLQDSEVSYGDMILIKTWRSDMPYIHVSKTNDVILSNSTSSTRNFYVYDHFGQGKNLEWARRGTTRQSSTSNNLFSQFAIDGNSLTFCSTSKEKSPWWEVSLPKDVLISNIYITNINSNDSNVTPLTEFDIILYDYENNVVDKKKYGNKSKDKYSWLNVNQIANRVRISLNKEANLNISEVKIYGQPVNYSVLLNEEMSKNLLSKKAFTSDTSLSFKHRTLPKVNNDMTVMFLLELNSLPKNNSNIFIKSKDITANRTPNLILQAPKLNTTFSTLHYIFSTDINNNEMGENFIVNYNIVPNKPFHFCAVHNAGINKKNGWLPCKFTYQGSYSNGNYLCNFLTREFYKVVLEDSEVFRNENIIELEDPNIYGFGFRGLYSDSLSVPTINIYINGILNTVYQVKGNIIQNTDSLVIGGFKKLEGFDGTMSFLKFSNRVIPIEYIQKESQILTGKLAVELISEVVNLTTQNTIRLDPNYLPELNAKNPEYTIYFWLNSQRPITGTGNDESIFEYGNEGLYFYSDKNQLFTKLNTGLLGIDSSTYKVEVNQWIHIAFIVKNKIVTLYTNGRNIGSKGLNVNEFKVNNFEMMKVGGFNGSISNFSFANYALSEKELKMLLTNNPNNEAFEKVLSSYYKSGCIRNPIDINDPYVDNYNSTWITFASKDDIGKLDQSIGDFKKLADEGIETEDAIKLKLAEKCYGKEDTQVRLELTKSKRSLKQATDSKDKIQCLPKAPFTCKKYSVGDFDIRTHPEFGKYIEKDKIREAPKPIDRIVQLPPDPNKYVSKEYVEANFVDRKAMEQSPAFLEMKSKLEDMSKQVEKMNEMKSLVDKCQQNNNKLDKLEQYVSNLKKLAETQPIQWDNIQSEISKINKEMSLTNKEVSKDSKQLLDSLSLTDVLSKKADLDKEYNDLLSKAKKDKLESNLELQNIQQKLFEKTGKCGLKQSVEDTIKTLDKSSRSTPFSSENVISSNNVMEVNGKGKWLQKQLVDLDKIEKMVRTDLQDIQEKLDKMTNKVQKYQSQQKVSNVEAANITNEIASIKNKAFTK